VLVVGVLVVGVLVVGVLVVRVPVVGVLVVFFAVDVVVGVLLVWVVVDRVVVDRVVVVGLLGDVWPPPLLLLGLVGAELLELVLLERPEPEELTIARATATPAMSAKMTTSRTIHWRPAEGRRGGVF
jgi:hypothetical protein